MESDSEDYDLSGTSFELPVDNGKPKSKYKALKKYENELIECLEDIDLVSLARQAAECKVVPEHVKGILKSLHPEVPHSLACRYLLYYVYNNLTIKSFDFWMTILSRLKVASVVVSQVKQCHDDLFKIQVEASLKANLICTDCHIPHLTEILADCSHKWQEIGTSLGLPDNELKSILARMHILSSVMCLKEVLTAWVLCKFSTAKPPTLESLKEALYSETAGLGTVACRLDSKINLKELSAINLATEKPPTNFEIVSQTRNQAIAEGEGSILLEVQATTAIDGPVSFKWFKNGHQLLNADYQVVNSYNGYHIAIFVLPVNDLLAEGAYMCILQQYKHTLRTEPVILSVSTVLDKYQKNLVDFYTEQPEVPEDTWPPVSCDTYISLALIKQDSIHHAGEYGRVTIRGDADDIYKDKENLVYEKAFSNLESGARLLVEGRPGSGKTTLVHKISQDWAKTKLEFRHVRLLILVHLRAFFSNPNVDLKDILNCYFRSSSTKKEIIEYAEKHSGLGFCLILDGLDEYLPENNKAYIFQLIRKMVLPKAVVIVASRPAAAAKFRPNVSRQIEVIGFLKEQIFQYVNNYPLSDLKRESLQQYLNQHPNIHHMCYLPIHAAMVCFLFDSLSTDLPQTETEIYKEFTKFTILRILYRSEEEYEVYMDSIEDLSDENKEVFYKICELAFQMCKTSKQVMTQAEALSIFKVKDDSSSFGLFTVDRMAMKCGFQRMYTFLHLTFQEYLAACYIASLGKVRQLELIVELGKSKQMFQVWKFYCGVAKFVGKDERFKSIISNITNGSLYKIQCCFESQDPHICDTVVENNSLSFHETFLSPSNFTEMAFILSNTCHIPVSLLSFEGCVFGKESVDVLIAKAKSSLSLLETICSHQCSFEQLKVVTYFSVNLPSLELLDLSGTHLDKNKIEILGDLCQSNLKVLKVGGKGNMLYSSPELVQLLVVAFKPKFFKNFNIFFSGIGKKFLTSNLPSLPYCFPYDYPDLDMSFLELSSACIKALSIGFMQNPYFIRLTLTCCGIDDKAASCLSLGLKHLINLKVLEVGFNSIGDSGAIDIANSVKNTTKLTLLDFAHNDLSSKGALVIASTFSGSGTKILLSFNKITSCECILKQYNNVEFYKFYVSESDLGLRIYKLTSVLLSSSSCSDIIHLHLSKTNLSHLDMEPLSRITAEYLITLDLSSNALGVNGAEIISRALKQCSQLCHLNLSSNNLKCNGIQAIAIALKYCVSLLQLKINSNDIKSEGVRALVKELKHCAILQELHINSNDIQCTGAINLACAFSLGHWNHFYVLDISSNGIGSEGIKALAESLIKCTTLQELYVSNNNIQSGDSNFLAMTLQNFTNFQVLEISCNSLQSSGAMAVVDALHHSGSVRTINISDNGIMGENGAQSFGVTLAGTQEIDISNNSRVGAPSGIVHDTMLQKLNDIVGEAHTKEQSRTCVLMINKVNLLSEGAKLLAGYLKLCSNLQILHISSNGIGSDGAEVLARGLVYCSQLTELYIGDNQICNDGATAFSGTLKHLKNLQVIDISNNDIQEMGTLNLMNEIVHCTTLQKLNVSNNVVGEAGIKIFATNFQSICALMINNVNLPSDSAKCLADYLKLSFSLQILHICSNSMGSDYIAVLAKGLVCCSQLCELYIGDNQIGNDGAIVLGDSLKHLTKLQAIDISNNGIGDDGTSIFMNNIKHCTVLQALNVSRNVMGSAGIVKIESISKTIRFLNVEFTSLGSVGAKSLASVLYLCFSLEKLHIGSNDIGDDGAEALGESLKFCTKLAVLDICSNPILTKGARAIAVIFKFCPILCELNFSYCNIKCLQFFSLPLMDCQNLQVLNTTGISLSPLRLPFEGHRSLVELIISNCSISPHCVSLIANLLTKLRLLDISRNSIRDDGVLTLADALRHNSKLHTLLVNANKIGIEGATFLAKTLQNCTSLRTLDISSNLIQKAEHSVLKDCLDIAQLVL